MTTYRPVKSNHLNQDFGEDNACSKIGVRPFVVITRRSPKCPPNWESFYKALGLKGHNGKDMAAWHGEPIYFSDDSDTKWFAKTETDGDGGRGVDIISEKPILDGERIKFRFWHILNSNVYDGQEVKFGDLIAFADNTGASSGDHLHWGKKQVNKNGATLNKDNGYYGGINFEYENEFVLNVLEVEVKALSVIDLARKIILEVDLFIKNSKKK